MFARALLLLLLLLLLLFLISELHSAAEHGPLARSRLPQAAERAERVERSRGAAARLPLALPKRHP